MSQRVVMAWPPGATHFSLIREGVERYMREHGLNWRLEMTGTDNRDSFFYQSEDHPPLAVIGDTPECWADYLERHQVLQIGFQSLKRASSELVQVLRLDDVAVGHYAARYVAERGFTDVAVGENASQGAPLRRAQAFLDRARELGMRVHEFNWEQTRNMQWIDIERARYNWARSRAEHLFLFFHQDRSAVYFCLIQRRLGLHIPEQVSVMGVDNSATQCEMCVPRLSSIAPSYHKVGMQAASTLHRMLQGLVIQQADLLVAPHEVVERNSLRNSSKENPLVRKVLKMLRTEAGQSMNISDLAKQFDTSTTTLQRHFHEAGYPPPKSVQMATRLDRARHLLIDEDTNISSIARQVGFKSLAAFSNAIKKQYGLSPSELRKQFTLKNKS